jgi:hypothetical protein
MSTPLTLPGLEAVYDQLAQTLDAAPAGTGELLLVKLALLLAQDLGDAERFAALCRTALQDLENHP